MTILFMDGFELTSTTNILRKWTSGSIASVQTGRFEYGQCVRMQSNALLVRSLGGNYQTLGVAFGCRFGSINTSYIAGFRDSGTNQCEARLRADGRIDLARNGTLLATSSGAVSAGVWYHFELKAYIHDTAGTLELKVNGASFVSASNVDTKNTANAYATEATIQANAITIDYDDLAVWNTAGSANNDWLGDCRIFTQLPDGAGNYSQWTPSAGSNPQNVDETPADDDTTYNSASAAGSLDSYTFPDISGSGAIKAVQATLTARKDDAGTRTLAALLRRGSDSLGGNQNLADTYAIYVQLWETDPITAAAWTLANFNNTEFGIKLVA